ncbi:Olfactory receptor 51V1 [Pteropus alecto]|uniref:Olfactory receptor 51V1 n=1 Tax=Pteropus alecto TaxID=9402 RepID=L5KCN7_PTEAL|nr:Olfactory receptor 51V1 [Pteropus alecto]
MKLACANTHINSAYVLFVVHCTLGVDAVLIVLSYGLILHTVLSIASKAERLKALNTCVSHICAVLLFYTPMIGLSMIHRFGKQAFPSRHLLLSYLHCLTPPLPNLVVYTIKTKQIRMRMLHLFWWNRRGSLAYTSTNWFSIPFSSIYATIFLGNCLVLHVIRTEPSLLQPMFYFLAMLALTDLCMGLSTVHTMLEILWGLSQEVKLDACIAQTYFVHGLPCTESGVLHAMAIDRFTEIHSPLRYTSILTNNRIIHFMVIIADLLRLACSDICFNSFYALALVICTLLLDATLIIISYIFILHTVLAIAS